MIIKAILFDINGTLIDINTDESKDEIYRAISHTLTYQGIFMHHREVRDEYYRIMDVQRKTSQEEYPEFDVVEIFRELINERFSAPGIIPPDKREWLPLFLAETYRGISRNRLQLYPGALDVLNDLRPRYKLAVVSDAQSAWCLPEMRAVGIDGYFDSVIVSGDFGYRKPDSRLFSAALTALDVAPEHCLFVGNDMYRDVYAANKHGIKTVFYSSNQGSKKSKGVEPDYIIYHFPEMMQAVEFFWRR